MSSLLLDTNAYVAFKRGQDDAIEILQIAEQIIVPVVVLGELLAGFVCGNREAINRRELTEFLDTARVLVADLDCDTASWYGRIYAGLKKAGRPIPSNDIWIGATALQNGAPVFSYDAHFEAIAGLVRVSRPEDLMP